MFDVSVIRISYMIDIVKHYVYDTHFEKYQIGFWNGYLGEIIASQEQLGRHVKSVTLLDLD